MQLKVRNVPKTTTLSDRPVAKDHRKSNSKVLLAISAPVPEISSNRFAAFSELEKMKRDDDIAQMDFERSRTVKTDVAEGV